MANEKQIQEAFEEYCVMKLNLKKRSEKAGKLSRNPPRRIHVRDVTEVGLQVAAHSHASNLELEFKRREEERSAYAQRIAEVENMVAGEHPFILSFPAQVYGVEKLVKSGLWKGKQIRISSLVLPLDAKKIRNDIKDMGTKLDRNIEVETE